MVLAEISNGQTIYYWQGLDLLGQSDGTSAQYFQYDGLGSVRQLADYDGLGSVRQLADSAGTAQYTDTFDPYGNLYAASAGTDGQTYYAFTGEQQDANGLLFLRARYYSAESGRFFQADPSRQEQNPYLYSYSNPITFTDPSSRPTK
jgi:RHS repeat-associated protein